MAVVVQYAINSDVSGVLTTCHPKTADPSNMVITANFGLGVVSFFFFFKYYPLQKLSHFV